MNRIQQIEQEIAAILATPLPPHPERYIPREALHALQTEKLTLEGFAGGDAREIDLAARCFAIHHVPQNLFSYPMSKRETRVMAVDPDFLKEYASRPKQPPTSPEVKAQQLSDLMKPWGKSEKYP
jgi:hypothetical protein